MVFYKQMRLIHLNYIKLCKNNKGNITDFLFYKFPEATFPLGYLYLKFI